MHGAGAKVKASLRETLVTSRVCAVAIAVLMFWAVLYVFYAVWSPLAPIEGYLISAVQIPFHPDHLTTFRYKEIVSPAVAAYFFFASFVNVAAAWLLARWIYGSGPICVLRIFRGLLGRRNHA